MPKTKTLSTEAKLKKKRLQQQQRRATTNQDKPKQFIYVNYYSQLNDVVQIDTSTKKNVEQVVGRNLRSLGKRQEPTITTTQLQQNIKAQITTTNKTQTNILQEVIQEVDEGEILQNLPKQQRKSLVDYMGRKFKELQDSQQQFQQTMLAQQQDIMDRMQNIEQKFSTFLSSTASLLGNNDYITRKNIEKVFDTWQFTADAPKKKLILQLSSLEKFELEQLDVHCNHYKLNKWYRELKFIQFALYMVILEQQGAAKNTLKNNASSFRKLSSLLIKYGLDVLTRKDQYKIRDFVLQEYKDVNTISTIRGQLSDYCAAIKTVTGKPLKIKIAYKEFAAKKPMIKLNDILDIIKYYKNHRDELLKLLSFFLYLLVLTGARNETIRTLRFDQFVIDNTDIQPKYLLRTYASKTGKSNEYKVSEDVYRFVQILFKKRQQAMDKLIEERGHQLSQNQLRLVERRRTCVFTFYSQAALHQRISQMKAKFQGIKNIDQFIVHNIRTLRLIDVFESKGLKAAQEFAGHSSGLTTLQSYLLKKNQEGNQDIDWGEDAKQLNINDMQHFDQIVKKSDMENESSDSDNEELDRFDLLDEPPKKSKVNNDEEEKKEEEDDEDNIIGIVI